MIQRRGKACVMELMPIYRSVVADLEIDPASPDAPAPTEPPAATPRPTSTSSKRTKPGAAKLA